MLFIIEVLIEYNYFIKLRISESIRFHAKSTEIEGNLEGFDKNYHFEVFRIESFVCLGSTAFYRNLMKFINIKSMFQYMETSFNS